MASTPVFWKALAILSPDFLLGTHWNLLYIISVVVIYLFLLKSNTKMGLLLQRDC